MIQISNRIANNNLIERFDVFEGKLVSGQLSGHTYGLFTSEPMDALGIAGLVDIVNAIRQEPNFELKANNRNYKFSVVPR